jgi:hypothetical protein
MQAMAAATLDGDAVALCLSRGGSDRDVVEAARLAAAGGATETTSVDLSNTYLDWTRSNLARNGFKASALFVPSRPSAEPTEIGRIAVVQNLATDVVANLQGNW